MYYSLETLNFTTHPNFYFHSYHFIILISYLAQAQERTLIEGLMDVYKTRNKVPLVPSAETDSRILTVKVEDVYVHPEMYLHIKTQDLPFKYRLTWEQLSRVMNGQREKRLRNKDETITEDPPEIGKFDGIF